MLLSRRQGVLAFFWLFFAIFILFAKIVPGGRASYELEYRNLSQPFGGRGFIGQLTPAERVSQEKSSPAIMIGDPVYFSVFTPRTFSEAKVTVTYKNELTSATPVIEVGVLVDNLVWRYQTKSLENKTLDNLSDWQRLQEKEVSLYQKDPIFSSVSEFMEVANKNPEKICSDGKLNSCLALYNPPALDILQKRTPGPLENFVPWTVPLKGAHQFYFSAEANKKLFFSFELIDLNLDKRADPVYLTVYKGSQIICQDKIEDNSGGEGEGKSYTKEATLSCPPLTTKETLKLEIKGSSDLIIKEISDAPGALNFVGRVYPVQSTTHPLIFWTDRNLISLTTANPASRQKISFGSQEFLLAEPYQRYEFTHKALGLKQIVLEKDDVILETGGVFSLSPETFFNPDFDILGRYFTINDETKYIIADYNQPLVKDGGLKEASATFNTKAAYRENGKYSFMISVPGLAPEDLGQLVIEKIKVEFSGRTLWEKLADYF
jgi:hypothetical protein